MTLGGVLGIVGVAVVVIVLIMFPEARALLKGLTRVFIQDRAATPSGAKAIYAEKIDQLNVIYNKASDSYRTAAGNYEKSKEELGNLQKRLQKVSSECESLYKQGKMELAMVKAEERTDIIQRIHTVDEMVTKYEEATKQAQLVFQQAEKELRRTKAESKEVVQRMEDNKNLAALYDQLDELKNTEGVDKMLDAVKEADKQLSVKASGAKTIHQNKLSTKLEIAEKESYRAETEDFMSSLAAKYGTPGAPKEKIPMKR
jgi:uncharacterized membrane protein YccC